MEDCLFCKIAKGEIACDKVYEDDKILAFNDISPVAPVHILVIPKKHIGSIKELEDEDYSLMVHIIKAINQIAKEKEIDSRGFRIVNNIGLDGGQTVEHIHFHLLGGRTLQWPPG